MRSELPRTALISETCFVKAERFAGKSARVMQARELLMRGWTRRDSGDVYPRFCRWILDWDQSHGP